MDYLQLYNDLGHNYTAIALKLGISRSAARYRVHKQIIDSQKSEPPPTIETIVKPITPAYSRMRVLYFTDAHNQPDMSQERFIWLAKLCNDLKPDILFDGGDTQDFQSLCSHEKNETYRGKLKPALSKDLEAAAQMYALINRNLTHKCRKIVTLGNHEHRLWSYEDKNPEMYGIPSTIYTKDILEAAGWEWKPYGVYFDLFGVNFIHVPFSGASAPISGISIARKAADKAVKDVVFGHTHYLELYQDHKHDNNKSVTAFNAGCFMPLGYVADYAKKSRKEYWYGAHLITIANSKIDSIKSYSMNELQHLYGG